MGAAKPAAWVAFFSGSYTVFVDGDRVEQPATLQFMTTTDDNMLQVLIAGTWTTASAAYMRLKTGPIPGRPDAATGGFIHGQISAPGYGYENFHLGCFELVQQPGGGWVVGMDPAGQNVGTRFDGKVDRGPLHHSPTLVLDRNGARNRPDTNYPWNL